VLAQQRPMLRIVDAQLAPRRIPHHAQRACVEFLCGHSLEQSRAGHRSRLPRGVEHQ
jgi:hypothetical protein